MTDAAPATDERLQAMLFDYGEGTLSAEERAEVDAALAADPVLRAELEEVRDSTKLLKSLPPAAAPTDLGKTVEATIARRSAGRFFGRRTLGDRVPFGVLFVIAIIALVVILGLLWSSPTGSLKRDRPAPPPPPSEPAAPHPR